jgi:hypothetical protein
MSNCIETTMATTATCTWHCATGPSEYVSRAQRFKKINQSWVLLTCCRSWGAAKRLAGKGLRR